MDTRNILALSDRGINQALLLHKDDVIYLIGLAVEEQLDIENYQSDVKNVQ